MTTPAFLSAASANALISDLRPTSLSSQALDHINLLIDEVLSLLITHSESINPTHIRVRGVQAVFSGDKTAGETTGPRALGRSAVAEAELELRSWYESHPAGKKGAFGPDGQSTGLKGIRPSFPIREATELLKLRCVSFSTLAPTTPPSEAYEEQILTAWKLAGGDTAEETLSPAGLWMTAILEHVCEHVLSQLARVVARDSSIAVAGVQDLYVALCEDENIWGLFKRLQVKTSLEHALKHGARQRGGTPVRPSSSTSFGAGSNTNGAKSSLPASASFRDTASLDQSRQSASTPVEHIHDSNDKRRGGTLTNVARKVSTGPLAKGSSASHNRSPSLLSANTKSIVNAFNDQYDQSHQRHSSQDEDEFDALVRSGETMKVSLTPSRLKTFEGSPSRKSPASPTKTQYVRAVRPTQTPDMHDLSPLTPANAYSSNDSPRKAPTPRPHSGPRLVARNAATITEDDDEDDEELMDGSGAGGGAGGRNKKETLADLFASEPRSGSRKSSTSSGKRTVPAVVLGSPPPRESSLPPPQSQSPQPAQSSWQPPSAPSTVRRTKRNDLTVDTTEDDLFKPRNQPRSEAQELADFFSNTQPPAGAGAGAGSTAPPSFVTTGSKAEEPPKSAKSFKSFMSRMTGKKKENKEVGDRDRERPPMPSSFSQQGLAGLVKRQKSTTSFSSSALPTPIESPPVSAHQQHQQQQQQHQQQQQQQQCQYQPHHQQQQPLHPYPETLATIGDVARGSSNGKETMTADKMTAIGIAALGMGSGATSTVVSPEKRMNGLVIDTGRTTSRALVADEAEVSGSDVAATLPEPSRPADSPTIGDSADTDHSEAEAPAPTPIPRPMHAREMSPSVTTGEYVVVNKADAIPAPLDTRTQSHSSLSPTKPTPSTASQSHFPSEAASFKTANESSDLEPDPETPNKDTDAMEVLQNDRASVTAPTASAPVTVPAAAAAAPTVPSIPLSDLTPLRGLLQHATTARECQLLLGAILSQLGVPLTSSEVIDPEARVAAWLLAGREGPVDYPSPTSFGFGTGFSEKSTLGTGTGVETRTAPEESITTPNTTLAELQDTSDLPTEMDQGGQEQLEDQSEEKETATERELDSVEEVQKGRYSESSQARTSMTIDSVPEVKEARSGLRTEAVPVSVAYNLGPALGK